MCEFMKIWEDMSVPWENRRKEILDLLSKEEYGRFLPKPSKTSWEVLDEDKNYCGGKAVLRHISLTAEWEDKSFTFPFRALLTGHKEKNPFVVYIAFDEEWPNRFMNPEIFCDRGVSVLYLNYQDVTSDNGDMTNGLSGILFPDGKRGAEDPGKLVMWAWAAQRVLDYGLSLDCLDPNRAGVGGHSRLGKTALVAAAFDRRFTHVFCNESGCGGASVARGKEGETIKDICRQFPFWFCENYKKYVDNEEAMPFDQHFLLGAVAPAQLCVGSADADTWAGPKNEYLGCVLASEVYEKLGLQGLIAPKREPKIGDNWNEGRIAYHYRDGEHYFREEDWKIYMDILLR